jgi:DNA-binding NtrC family response regulator
VSDLSEALEVVGREEVEIVLVGVDLPLFFYDSFFRSLRQMQPRLPVLLLMGEGVVREKGFALPFSDGLSKPFGVESLREKVRVLLLQRDWVEKSRGVRRVLPGEERVKSWFYSSRVPVGVRERVLKVAGSSLPVFIQGEEGTGGSEVARAVHLLGPWRDRSFLRFFCRDLTVEGFMGRLSFWLSEGGRGEGVCGTLFFEEVESLGWEVQGLVMDLMSEGYVEWPGVGGVGLEVRVISSSVRSLGV